MFILPRPSPHALGSCALATLSLLFLNACERAQTPRAASAVPVETAPVLVADLPARLSAVGAVEPLRTVEVKARIEGVVETVHFQEGDEIAADALLVTLDRRPFELALKRARARHAVARAEASQAAADANRYHLLDAQNAVSKERLSQLVTARESAEASVLAAEADLAEAELRLGYTGIRAPISGRAGRRLLHEGALVRANDSTLVVLNQLDPVTVTFSVPETALSAIQAALAEGPVPVRANPAIAAPPEDLLIETNVSDTTPPPALRPDAVIAAPVEGLLAFVDNRVDPATGTIVLKAVFPNADRRLWPGQFVDVAVTVGVDRSALVVPASAIQRGQRGPQVFVVRGDLTAELRAVRLGRSHAGRIAVTEGVSAGETIVTNGQLRLVPGARVDPRTVEQAVADRGTSAAPAKS